jgi:hypothetical protein
MIAIHAAWDNASQEWEAHSANLPKLRCRARTLKELREAIARMFGPDYDHPFQMIVLAQKRETRKFLH